MFTRILALAACLAAASAYPALAQEPGNAGSGFNYANQACALCHAIRQGDNPSANPKAPSFQAIANTPGVTGISLAAALHSVHENMPNFVLRPNERDNIIAYILSLKRER
jgi:mono/diheme cytochrome c family protein